MHSSPLSRMAAMRVFLILMLAWATMATAAAAPIKPPALAAGDTIAIVAPSRPVDMEALKMVREGLVAQGYKVKLAGNVGKRWGYLAGSDEERATGIMDAWRDPEVKAIFCAVGGSGTTRMMDLLDYDYIRKHPKIFSGFSDITGLHLSIQKKANIITFHAPTSKFVYANNVEKRPYAAPIFWQTMRGEFPPSGTEMTYDTTTLTTKTLCVAPGVAEGRLIGGNLSLVAAVMGTPYEPDTDGKILFLEDVHEEPYRLDRMLSTLRLAGKLDKCAGVVLGRFADCNAEEPKRSFTIDEVLDQYFKGRPYPVISRFPVGHVEENVPIPEGAMARIDGNKGTLTILEAVLGPAK
ncbi:LD-carboxypeptidase [Candidatus Sumerlaeota bacterium]|nr:LD-carboxypeptidase [Candidatus Sumerlaeota bacterium]